MGTPPITPARPAGRNGAAATRTAPAAAADGATRRPGLLVLVDGNALVHRAYHAVPAGFMTTRGEPTNAVYGFTSTLLKVLNDLQPDYCAVAFDKAAPTFRHLASADYKATRPRMADDLRPQFERVKQVVRALRLPIYEQEGYEADDLLGCLAQQAAEQGLETVIVTGDMDTLQLVGEHVRVLAPRGRLSETVLYDVAAVREREGVDPAQIPDLKALAGDPSDNIIGARGIGKKTAAKLLKQFGSVEAIYEHLDEVVPPRLREALLAGEALVRSNKRLATIARDLDCVLDLAACRVGAFERAEVLDLFHELEFRSLLDKLPQSQPGTRDAARAASAAPQAQQLSFFSGPGAPAADAGAPEAAAPGERAQGLVQSGEELRRVVAAVRAAGAMVIHPVIHRRSAIDLDLAGIALALEDGRTWYVAGLAAQEVLDLLRPVLEDEAIRKIAHDAKPLYTLLAEHGIALRGLGFDTMIAAYLLSPSVRQASVRQVVFAQLGREIEEPAALAPKGVTVLDVPPEQVAPVAMLEAKLLWSVAEQLRAVLVERAQLELYERVELPLIPVLSQMERAGVAIDPQVLGEMGRRLAEQIRRVELEIYNSVGHQFMINSPQQLGRVLAEELRLPLTKRTKTGYSTDATVLEELLGTHPVIEHILTYRELSKLKSTYVDALPAMINPRTGRVHTTFNQAATTTGRLSSEAPNLQNIPVRTELGRLIRRAFVAGSPDLLLLTADYAQIELRIAAHITRDPRLIEAFQNDVDVHAATAATVFNVPLEQVTAEQRRLAKTTNFAVLYGISDFGLSQRVGIPRAEAQRFIEAYLARHAGIRRYIEETLHLARERGYVETPLGRRRYLPELRSANKAVRAAGERMAINMPIQGAQADLIKLAMIAVNEALQQRGLRARMLLQVHDELVFEVPRNELDEVASLVRERMEGAMQLIVPIKVELKAGPNWYDVAPLPSARAA